MNTIENYLSDLNAEVQVLMNDEKLMPVPAFTQYAHAGTVSLVRWRQIL